MGFTYYPNCQQFAEVLFPKTGTPYGVRSPTTFGLSPLIEPSSWVTGVYHADMIDSSARKQARRARRQEESRARTIALLEELCRQNEHFRGEDTAWRVQLDKVASRLVYQDRLAGSGPESARTDKTDFVGPEERVFASGLQRPGN